MIIKVTGKYDFAASNITKKHESQADWKKFAMIQFEGDIDKYYSWLLARRYNIVLNKPLRGPHVTVVNDKYFDESKWSAVSRKYHGKSVDVFLCTDLRTDGTHWWLRAGGDSLWIPRADLGLPAPFWSFHMSIGYANEKNIDHSEYIHGLLRRFGRSYN